MLQYKCITGGTFNNTLLGSYFSWENFCKLLWNRWKISEYCGIWADFHRYYFRKSLSQIAIKTEFSPSKQNPLYKVDNQQCSKSNLSHIIDYNLHRFPEAKCSMSVLTGQQSHHNLAENTCPLLPQKLNRFAEFDCRNHRPPITRIPSAWHMITNFHEIVVSYLCSRLVSTSNRVELDCIFGC